METVQKHTLESPFTVFSHIITFINFQEITCEGGLLKVFF